jgi:hypothetical protein
MSISRRQFAHMADSAFAAAPLFGQGTKLTDQEMMERIKKYVGVSWQEQSLDGFKAGDPPTLVTGIATTGMATMDVLTRASKKKANLVVFSARKEFIEKNGRFNDRWRAHKLDPFAAGMAFSFSWNRP